MEVRQTASGMVGAYYTAHVLHNKRDDGLVEVRYRSLHTGVLHDSPLIEWFRPADGDALRPIPPCLAGGFHEALAVGAEIEVRHHPLHSLFSWQEPAR